MMVLSSVTMANNQARWVKWVYSRGAIGDIELWCETKEEAIATLKQYGFVNLNPDKLNSHGNGALVTEATARLTKVTS